MKKILIFLAFFSLMACNNTKAQTTSPSEKAAVIFGTGANPASVIHSGADTAWLVYEIPSAGSTTISFSMVGPTGNVSGTIARWVSVNGRIWTPYTTQNTSDSVTNTFLNLGLTSVPPSGVSMNPTGTAVYNYTRNWTYPYFTSTVGQTVAQSFPYRYMLLRYISAVATSPSTVIVSGSSSTRRVSPY